MTKTFTANIDYRRTVLMSNYELLRTTVRTFLPPVGEVRFTETGSYIQYILAPLHVVAATVVLS